MHVGYDKGGIIRVSLRNREVPRDVEDVRKNRSDGWICDWERREESVENFNGGQAPSSTG